MAVREALLNAGCNLEFEGQRVGDSGIVSKIKEMSQIQLILTLELINVHSLHVAIVLIDRSCCA